MFLYLLVNPPHLATVEVCHSSTLVSSDNINLNLLQLVWTKKTLVIEVCQPPACSCCSLPSEGQAGIRRQTHGSDFVSEGDRMGQGENSDVRIGFVIKLVTIRRVP